MWKMRKASTSSIKRRAARGARFARRARFGKPAQCASLAEIAALRAMVQGDLVPGVINPSSLGPNILRLGSRDIHR